MGINVIYIILVALVILISLIHNVIMDEEINSKINTVIMGIVAFFGVLLYGYGYSVLEDNILVASVRTIFSTCAMFAGKESFSTVSKAPLFENQIILFVFWITHLLAIYTLSNAAIKTFGKNIINHIRWTINNKGDLYIIYGVNDDTISLGKEIKKKKKSSLIFIDKKISEDFKLKISRIKAIYSDFDEAFNISKKFINNKLKINKRTVYLYCLDEDQNKNFNYAKKFANSIQNKKNELKVYLSMLGDENFMGKELHDMKFYDSVFVINRAELAARILINKLPTWEVLNFENGEAKNNFHAIVIGYGQTGQAVLKYLAMNGCFFGSNSTIKIFGKDKKQDGTSFITNLNNEFLGKNNYLKIDDGQMEGVEARSSIVSTYIKKYINDSNNKVNYIVICTGNEKIDNEIFNMIYSLYFNLSIKINDNERGSKVRIAMCSKNNIKYLADEKKFNLTKKNILTFDNLNPEEIDKDAKKLNGKYSDIDIDCKENEQKIKEVWDTASYYDKMSSRTAADFLPYFRYACYGKKEENFKENLGKTEHLRWSAFNYMLGYTSMIKIKEDNTIDTSDFEKRCKINKGKNARKDMDGKQLACLVEWDDLKKVAKIENEYKVNEKKINLDKYQKNDLDNVDFAFNKNNMLCFWLPDQEKGHFSNWYLSDFKVDGIVFHSGEQWFMYQKALLFNDADMAKKILDFKLNDSDDNKLIKEMGKKVSNFNDEIWKRNCDELIYKGLYEKFTQNKDLKNKLLSTGDKYLVEASPYDEVWGLGVEAKSVEDPNNWVGENRLGKVLMKVRSDIKSMC